MRFNNNLLLLASFLGVATARRRGCVLQLGQTAGTGFYNPVEGETLQQIAADFCTTGTELLRLNDGKSPTPQYNYNVPCKSRQRDCARIAGSDNGYYTVVADDQLQSISNDFCTDNDKLRSLNPQSIKGSSLTTGSIIVVPCSWN
ncbi:uncharacterized protein L3040_003518 [Drepanopeziza brunnea f. sp. 'multigermtubi']|uniref:LysM20p n=2 Tax=Drepanopeziza brunnea f. sp. 'multigermtubi' TaxID=698441 RepID=J9XN40_9HELO|nr:putative Ecp7(P20) [Drepanopeziza brunnea f. sp. 'multigermtubi' MB_m1]AFS30738.1 LysM20p [Drepanopeziza brunnea f. sp. 'multigermtubi']EKD16083.1 putative Ecp7(P20) [Drepanopeziza brunnea f. sp. 'multigermtubi' MB_m1]KAJ5047699.1 hypothetical protein L3040_003518 [Drepanopeziza brunnea f. sp. 'multigermtubi']